MAIRGGIMLVVTLFSFKICFTVRCISVFATRNQYRYSILVV